MSRRLIPGPLPSGRGPLALLAAVLLLAACRKPDEDLGLGLLPINELGVVVDTATLHAFTFDAPAIRTSGLTRNLLGSYLDPQFGLVECGIVAQLRLSSNNVGAGLDNSGLVADSLVLALAFDGINYAYGNLNPQVFKVYELDEALSADSTYNSDRVPLHLPDDLVAVRGGRIAPRPLSAAVVGNDSLPPQLRIRLDRALAERFLSAFGTPDLADNTAFLNFFKGLYIAVDNGPQFPLQHGILYFNLVNPDSKAVLHYRDLNATEPDLPRTYELPITQSSVRFTTVRHDHALAVDGVLPAALADTVAPAVVTHVQTLGGLRTAVRFPGIESYGGRGLLVAKAELEVPVPGTFNPYLIPPAQLFAFRKDDAGNDAFLPDQSGGLGAIDGNYSVSARAYRFNITRYVQQVIAGTLPNNGLELVAASNGITANRAILSGPAHPERPMRLRITFTSY